MSVTRRFVTFAGLAVVGLLVAGCFDKEPEQRKAFIDFLQTRVIDRPGLKIPIVKDEETAAMGPYAIHYGVMRRFHTALDESISKRLMQAVQAGSVRSFQNLANRREDFAAARDGMVKLREALDKAEAEANTDRAKLTQPRDLEIVYTTAYEKMVGRPARTIREIMPPLEGTLQSGQELADYIHEHKAKIGFSGSNLETNDPEVRRRLAQLLQSVTDKSTQLDAAKRQLQALSTN
ncbi:MAG: hypothetical protein JWN71_3006 [Xanthobacteraceae bacterium]|nr:hypothetical protein [Xanthobacteraceae bacterium]